MKGEENMLLSEVQPQAEHSQGSGARVNTTDIVGPAVRGCAVQTARHLATERWDIGSWEPPGEAPPSSQLGLCKVVAIV